MRTGGHLGVCVVLLAWAGMATGATLHVRLVGGGGYTSIQAAIDAAVSGRDRIEVEPGTYYEAINLKGKAVELYSRGGPTVTIIDGTGHNHVVLCVTGEGSRTILKGFTITGGNAGGGGTDAYGGGMYNSEASPAVVDCLFAGNSATLGGGIFNRTAHPSIKSCTFIANSADRGGAIYNEGGSPALSGCTFCSNSADRGAGIFNEMASRPIVTGCSFRDNEADEGAGMFNGLMSHAIVIDSTFRGNAAGSGGGIASVQGGADVTGCTFLDNTASSGGAGMYSGDGGGTVTNCTFYNNLAGSGGAMQNDVSDALVTNCIFAANAAQGEGGGMFNRASDPTVTHCTFVGNTAEISGGGMISMGVGTTSTVTNCVFWSNLGGQITTSFATFVVTYSDVQGGWTGEGNIDADPLFLDVAGLDCHLASGSPCIDKGTNSPAGGLPATDIEGNPRPADGDGDSVAVADMGAYEASAASPGQLVTDLIADVLALGLEPTVSAALTAPSNAALSILNDGNPKNDSSAASDLKRFIRTVEAYRGGQIADTDADTLIGRAQAIIALLASK